MDDTAESKLYYSMGEATRLLNVTPSLLRFWEKEFEAVSPKKNKKGNRIYTREDLDTLKLILFLTREQGHTLQGAREKLKNHREHSERNMQIMESLKRVRQFLTELKEDL